MVNHKIAFIVPTMDREKDLQVLLDSLELQSHKPDQIIIVDGSYTEVEYIANQFPSLNITYLRVFPPSLPRQKNAGIKALYKDITLVGYLDDDMELFPDAVEKMIDFWNNADQEYGGAGFAFADMNKNVGKLRKFFGIDSDVPGKVFSNGFVSMLEKPSETVDVDWLAGGASVWKREVINNYSYDEWFQGSGFMEDMDYSYGIREKYKLILLADAKLKHHTYPVRGDRYYLLGKWQIINRLYFVRKYSHRGMSIVDAWMASFSIIIVNLLASLAKLDYDRFRMTLGNIVGIFIEITKKETQISGHLKRIDSE